MKRLWMLFVAVLVLSFSVLCWIGTRIYQEQPPIPQKVQTTDGKSVVDAGQIEAGQNVWQSMGGMELGSVWGHGSYVAPIGPPIGSIARPCSSSITGPPTASKCRSINSTRNEKPNSSAASPNACAKIPTTPPPARSPSIQSAPKHSKPTSNTTPKCSSTGKKTTRSPLEPSLTTNRLRHLCAFFFWTAWSAATDRPDDHISYTHNWPFEPLVGNRPSGETVVWTGVSIIMLLAGISAMVWWYASQREDEESSLPAEVDPLGSWQATPSQKATLKYFWVVAALILVQMLLGVVTAHYGVEGDAFYGFPLSKWLPYSVTRTWHVQLGIFWIATAWLAAGLFIGPLVSNTEPKGQRLGVNILFLALLVVVFGSLAGEWLSIQHKLPSDAVSFLFGHQGYEYVDLGRVWQIALLVGLLLWLFLVVRVVRPALRAQEGGQKQLVSLLLVSTTAIALFYGAGLGWGQHTHLTMVEYWRWWVVHLWVEGFFEVFATTVIAFFFMRLNLIRPGVAAAAALLSATIFLSGGIIGTCHHLYFSGTPTVALAWGSVFSALEVVPLVLVGFDAMDDLRRSRATQWVRQYKWPIYFFVAVAFWNMVGAGLFGFMINPPIALYYMQGLNTTPVHGHAALFGVYGMLGIGLMLICLRALIPGVQWKEGLLCFSFWAMNGGLMAMCVLSLLPVGLMQTWASVEHGYWYARSGEFLHTPVMQTLRWMRIPGDTIFALAPLRWRCSSRD